MNPIMMMLGALGAGLGLWMVALGCGPEKASTEVPSHLAGYAKGVTMPEKLQFTGCTKLPIIIGQSETRDREVRELLKECFHDHGNYPTVLLPWPEYDIGSQPDCDPKTGWCLSKTAFPTDKDVVLRGVDEETLVLRIQRTDEKVVLYNQRERQPFDFSSTFDAQQIADWNLLVLTIRALEDNRAEVERIAAGVAAERAAQKQHLGMGDGSQQ